MRLESKSLRPVFFAGWACISLFAVWRTLTQTSDSSSALMAGILLVASLALSRYVLDLSFASSPMLYLSLLGLFHLGLVVPWALGIYDISRAPWFVPFGLSQAMALIIYSIVAYQFGLLAAFSTSTLKERSPIATELATDNSELFVAGSLLFLAGVAMFVVGLIGLDPTHYFRLVYSDIFRLEAESDPRFFGTGIMVASIGISIGAAGASKKRFRTVFIGAGVWLLALFFWGFRGPALIAGLIVYVIALRKGVRFPGWFPWFAAASLVVALPVMRVAREQPLDQRIFKISPQEFNPLDGPAEMGASIRPLIETVALVGPANYRHGRTYWTGIKAVIPNIALRWKAPAAETTDDLPPSLWITEIVDPWAYKNYGGLGFSAIAEPYMNFGLIGVLVYFFFLAALLVRLENVSLRSSYALASWALILGPLLWTTRNDSSNFFRPAIWGLLCLGVLRAFSRSYTLLSHARGQISGNFKGVVPE